MQYLLRTAIRNDSIESELQWLETQAPGIFDIASNSSPAKFRAAQGVALDAWYVNLPREELLSRLDQLQEYARSMGFDPSEDPYTHMNNLAMRGEISQAVDVALKRIFPQSVAFNLGWEETFAQAQYAGIVADSRVQAAMQRWEEEEAQLRSDVQAYLADLMAAG